MSGDFVATPTNGAATITITGLPFTLEAKHVTAGQIKKIAVTTGLTSTLAPTSVSVSGGVITLGGIANFATGDELAVTLIGPDKAYDTSLDNQLVAVQNPVYAHTTSVETLISETNLLASATMPWKAAAADAGGSATSLKDADGTSWTNAYIAIGYRAYDITEATSALVTVATSGTITTGAGVTDWSTDSYSLPLVKRYEINMDTYNFLTIHYRLNSTTLCNAYLKIYGTLDASATVDDDILWVDMSADIFGSGAGIVNPVGTTNEGLITIDTPVTMLKYMVKLIVESNSASSSTNTYTVFIKKSS
jgi:hypothetical protein